MRQEVGGQAACSLNLGYQPLKTPSNSLLRTLVRACSRRCAPRRVHCICCFLTNRLSRCTQIPEKCALWPKYCTQFPGFIELLALNFRTETGARKKDSVVFVLISWTNFSRNFVRVSCAIVRALSAVTMQLNAGKGLKTNKRDSGI